MLLCRADSSWWWKLAGSSPRGDSHMNRSGILIIHLPLGYESRILIIFTTKYPLACKKKHAHISVVLGSIFAGFLSMLLAQTLCLSQAGACNRAYYVLSGIFLGSNYTGSLYCLGRRLIKFEPRTDWSSLGF